MSKHQDYVQKTEAIVEPILQKYQFELVDVEFVKEAGSWHLRVYIDKELFLHGYKIISADA